MSGKIIVVGGLAAGPAAASKAKRTDPTKEVIMLEKGLHISYGICEMPYLLSGKFQDYRELILFNPDKFKSEKGVNVLPGHELREVDARNREIKVFDSAKESCYSINYDKLILALGSNPVKISELPEAANIFYFKFLHDGIKLINYIKANQPKNAVVFGSGFIGLEVAESLASIGMRVKILGKNDLPMEYFETAARQRILNLLLKAGVEYIPYQHINSFSMKGNLIGALEIDKSIYESDLIISAIGVEPNTSVLKGSGIDLGMKNGVSVDGSLRTNKSGIFACGDCCEFNNKITLKKSIFPFANIAQKTGWIAGENAAGSPSRFTGVLPAYGLKIFNIEFSHVGLTKHDAELLGYKTEIVSTSALDKPAMFADAERINISLLYNSEDKVLLGVSIFGKAGASLRANILSVAINNRLTLSDLVNLDFVYHPLMTPIRDPIYLCASLGLK